jgi:peptidoglycan/LPS O-acetylase OafA/YrhL
MVQTAPKSSYYIPTLDGWRAVAVLLVLVNHDFGLVQGILGVKVFFAISGLLICGRLLEEESRTGRISLRNFYIRRAFRILPPALSYLALAAVLLHFGVFQAPRIDWWAALLFFRNFLPVLEYHRSGWVVQHYWSLSLEEQFYFLLPAILVFARRWREAWLGGMIVASLAWGTWAVHTRHDFAPYRPDIALNLLLVPALMALWLARRPGFRRFMVTITRPWPLYWLAVAPLIWTNRFYHQFLLCCLMPVIVLCTVLHPEGWLGRILELAPLRWIGRISYSLYIWQQVFMTRHYAPEENIHWVTAHFLQWPLTLLLACASYYWMERPMMALGHKLAKSAVPGRGEEAALPA